MKNITVEITEHDLEMFKELVEGWNETIVWNYDDVTITFVKGDEE